MHKHIVLVNFVGGVPHALHKDIIKYFGEGKSCSDRVLLSNTNNYIEMEHCAENMFRLAHEVGFKTALFGPTFLPDDAVSSGSSFPDPHKRHCRRFMVDHTSCEQTTNWNGLALDTATLREAADYLHRLSEASQPYFVCVNLLACRDTRAIAVNGSVVFTGMTRNLSDTRVVPSNLCAHVYDTGKEFAGEALANAHFTYFVNHACNILKQLLPRVNEFVNCCVENTNATVIHTCMSSFGLGEHGYIGEELPLRECCESFLVMANSGISIDSTRHHTLLELLLSAFKPTLSRHSLLETSCGKNSREIYLIREHTYACIRAVHDGKTSHPYIVFDLSIDPHETANIADLVPHIIFTKEGTRRIRGNTGSSIGGKLRKGLESNGVVRRQQTSHTIPVPIMFSPSLPFLKDEEEVSVDLAIGRAGSPLTSRERSSIASRPEGDLAEGRSRATRDTTHVTSVQNVAEKAKVPVTEVVKKAGTVQTVRARERRLNSLHR